MKSKGISPVVATVLLLAIAIAAVSSAAVFLQGTMDGLQDSIGDWVDQEDKKESSSMVIEYAYNSTSNGYLLVDVRNDGSRALSVEDDGNRKWDIYVNSKPGEWNYTKNSPYHGQDGVFISPSEQITLNTTEKFPSSGVTKEVEFTGPYGVRSSYVCLSQKGACES